jgi:uncharacterized Tic20 family protein
MAMEEQTTLSSDERNWAMFCHLAGLAGFLPVIPLLGNVLGPLVLWLLKREQYPFVDDQGKEALNFQITMLLATIVAGILMMVLIGLILVPAVIITNVVCVILATIRASKGMRYRYPFAIRLIK